ncbi:ParA family protein [Candidatus Woesearchaeota archaeon]|nr:ParA family protein [Candidatus Woesearchaeota archaeon]
MRRIAVINQKGGVGKTTTTINIAAGLARKGKKVLILDLDPQANVSSCFLAHNDRSMYHFLIDEEPLQNCKVNLAEFLDMIPADQSLAKAELALAGVPSRETVLRRRMAEVTGYDYIIVDCPPSLGLLNQNALMFAREAFIPVATEYLSLDALRKMSATIDEINQLFQHKLKITAIIPTMYDRRIKSSIATLDEIKKGYDGVVMPPISTSSKLKEAPSKGMTIYDFARSSKGAKDYLAVVDKVIEAEFYYG